MTSALHAPVALTISLGHENKLAPPSLVARLASPPSSPTKEELGKKEATAAALHEAHIAAVKAAAARDIQRAEDAKARKLRLLHANTEKIEKRSALAEVRLSNQREAEHAKREIAKQKRVALAETVAANRQAAASNRANRAEVLAQNCENAHQRRTKVIEVAVEKSAAQVKHALWVAAEQKEKEAQALVEAGETLSNRLEAAAMRREIHSATKPTSPMTSSSAFAPPPPILPPLCVRPSAAALARP